MKRLLQQYPAISPSSWSRHFGSMKTAEEGNKPEIVRNVNSFSPGRYNANLKSIIFKLIIQISSFGT